MSTQNKTQSSNQYNQNSMGVFNQMQSGIGSNLQDFMNNPLQSSFFNTQLQMAQRANQQRSQAQNAMLLQNSKVGGYNGNLPAFMQSQLAQNARGLSSNNASSFNNLLLGANQLRFGATQSAMGYKPLQTGQTQVQSQSGLGTWLPQVAGMGLGAISGMGGMGAFGKMMGGGGSGGSGGSFMTGDPYGTAANLNSGNMGFIGGMDTNMGYSNAFTGQ